MEAERQQKLNVKHKKGRRRGVPREGGLGGRGVMADS